MFAVNEVGVSESSQLTDYIKIEKITKTHPPTVEKPLKNVIGEPNQDLELVCIFGGIPQPKVTWLKDGKKLKTAKASYENRVATLAVTATESTEGEYKCTAANEYGEVETSCTLVVQLKPVIRVPKELINQKHKVGEEWSLTATVDGIPKPDITWYRNGSKIEHSKDIRIVTEKQISTITITELDRSHTSKYTIEASNKSGTSSLELSLKVYGKLLLLLFYYPTVKYSLIFSKRY